MKIALIAATILALAPMTVAAAPKTPAADARSLYTCAGNSLSRVSLNSVPHACCDGLLGCPQLLANTGLVKPKRDNRT